MILSLDFNASPSSTRQGQGHDIRWRPCSQPPPPRCAFRSRFLRGAPCRSSSVIIMAQRNDSALWKSRRSGYCGCGSVCALGMSLFLSPVMGRALNKIQPLSARCMEPLPGCGKDQVGRGGTRCWATCQRPSLHAQRRQSFPRSEHAHTHVRVRAPRRACPAACVPRARARTRAVTGSAVGTSVTVSREFPVGIGGGGREQHSNTARRRTSKTKQTAYNKTQDRMKESGRASSNSSR